MSARITPDIIEAAARAAFRDGFMRYAPEYENRELSDYDDGIRESWRVVARAALEAAAPLIAATALREAAEDWRRGHTFSVMEDWLCARADRIEKEDA